MDSYWVGSAIDRKSTSRCYFSMGSSVISWFGRMESYMALSITKEKYVSTCYLERGAVKIRYVIHINPSEYHRLLRFK